MPGDERSETEAVEVKKRRLRSALRDARNAIDMTQHRAAIELSWSQSKIVRIEQGAVPVTPTDVRAMLTVYEVADPARIEELVALAKEARVMKGFKAYSDVYPATTLDFFGFESSARAIYKFDPSVIPGLLQTREYARALQIALGNSEEVVERRLLARAERQVLLEQTDRPELHFILGEAALCRPVGGLEVMREQLQELKRLSEEDDIYLYLLPFKAGPHRGLGITFSVLQFHNPDDPDILYLETEERLAATRNTRSAPKVAEFLELYTRLQGIAEDVDEFAHAVDQIRTTRLA